MSLKSNITPILVASLYTFLSIGVHAQVPSRNQKQNKVVTREDGGSNSGGGYEHPDAKLLLEIVSKELADQIAKMDPKAFDSFPKDKKIGKKEFEQIIRNVVPQPYGELKRDNKDGQKEGLMFNYKERFCDQLGCGPRIIAMRPFYDAYKGDPVKQWEKAVKKSDVYLAKKATVRERLLHEAGHLLDVGITAATDHHGDIFAARIEQSMRNNFIICGLEDWWRNPTYEKTTSLRAFFINLGTGDRITTSEELFSPNDGPNAMKESEDSIRKILAQLAETHKSDGALNNVLDARNNPLSHEMPAKFSLGDSDVLYWQGKPLPFSYETIRMLTDVRQYTEFIRVNVKTGKGTLSFPYPGRKDTTQEHWSPENETYNFTEVKLNCEPKVREIDMKF